MFKEKGVKMTNLNQKLESFVAGCQALIDQSQIYSKPVLEVKKGRRYTKLVLRDTLGSSAMVFVFVDNTNGDVFPPAGFSAPAKHARGNIFDESNGLSKMSWAGPDYLR
jgi:hypothetical protein